MSDINNNVTGVSDILATKETFAYAGVQNSTSVINAKVDKVYIPQNIIWHYNTTPDLNARTVKAGAFDTSPKVRYIIEKITVLQPNKTMRVRIYDRLEFGHTPKDIICVVSEPDTFDMYWGCFIALSKFIHGNDITAEGIEYYAKLLSYEKLQIKEVNRAIKQYNKEIETEQKALEAEKEKKRQLEDKRAKRAKKKKAKAERERQQRISEFAEGILLAEQMLSPTGQGH